MKIWLVVPEEYPGEDDRIVIADSAEEATKKWRVWAKKFYEANVHVGSLELYGTVDIE